MDQTSRPNVPSAFPTVWERIFFSPFILALVAVAIILSLFEEDPDEEAPANQP